MSPVVPTAVLDAALGGRFADADALLAEDLRMPHPTASDAARHYALAALANTIAGRHAEAARLLALWTPVDPITDALGHTVACFVYCFTPTSDVETVAPGAFDAVWSRRETILGLDGELGAVVGYVAIEASMAAGQLVEAQQFAEGYLAREWSSTEAPVFARIGLARSLVFQGRVAEADAVAQQATDEARSTPAIVLAAGTSAYIAAQQERRDETERLTTIVAATPDSPAPFSVGGSVLCAYALGAVESVERAADMILRAGGGPSLPRLLAVDRAYGYELLVTAALERRDLAAARSWGRRAIPLSVHDMAAAAVERTLSRLDVASGRSASGADRAALSAARALVAGGRLDAARAEVLQATAIAATGAKADAVARLRGTAGDAERLGSLAVRNWSARELRRLGRRLRPVAGAGWIALSEREQQIALLAAEGYSNRMIGQALFLSERTVQSHLSRVLAALDVQSRVALPALLGRAADTDDLEFLTRRQREVAQLVARGLSNRAISVSLGISEKTVEKHVQSIFSRLQVSSRTGIASRVGTDHGESRPA